MHNPKNFYTKELDTAVFVKIVKIKMVKRGEGLVVTTIVTLMILCSTQLLPLKESTALDG
ncbi:hypothetical protein GLOIN_2v1782849 [Rhizophagus irregularis DAOM 181602=DAOM 197198]|uniref:Uncharacterized protein n=1 Tax=Rhizophagus irregularis (strain DAOM 181602 / DAOM 197198 / MUCL 43194) TaxID=747089 RepID=A0A2P4PGJ7_RHIID|nr:hypothetical protein GLOIN_2v1782849 [Rhizophagus irregularis DAOM 181602=DAOM 197198]POG64516.1 hypothetical protein GLOIN_2v1782849 [Rhizophagus irregularis DAOM 181602=DAOM 197198]|eukprot:XP_025171382.1 hypothetical protein GLOIN_2v1782849 [Rhizophagus irregularis DAOM 181602=DAOM 197198]